MKTKIFLLLSIISALFSCASSTYSDEYEKVLGGQHELRKFNVKTTTAKYTDGWYFVCVGGYSSHETTNTKIRFYFKNYKGEYQFMEKRLTKVNVKIDSTVAIPFVKFYWQEKHSRGEADWGLMYDWDVTRVIVYCKESDFQPEININDLK